MKITKKKIGDVTVTILTPAKGKVLTLKESQEENKIYLHDSIWLGLNDSPDNWIEVDDPELEKENK